MSSYRTKHGEKLYQQYLSENPDGCDFCRISEGDAQFVTATRSFKVIHNRFPYAEWDGQKVTDHLMVVPKAHIDSLVHFTPQQASEYLTLIGTYEANGYHVYARAVKSAVRSIAHQHTHLIQGASKPRWFMLYLNKPYILIAR
jgi:diadenosine tetraphosphate (Ap4A) HIT family hydrolase